MAKPAESQSLMKRPADLTGTNIEGFLVRTALYIEGNPTKLHNDKSKVSFVLSLMEGKAAVWAETFMEEVLAAVPHDLGTSIVFGDKLWEAFGDPNKKQTAQVELSPLKQGNMTATEFFFQFDIARRCTGHGGTTSNPRLIEWLQQNLSERLVNKIMEHDCQDNYKVWKEKA